MLYHLSCIYVQCSVVLIKMKQKSANQSKLVGNSGRPLSKIPTFLTAAAQSAQTHGNHINHIFTKNMLYTARTSWKNMML